MKKPSEAHKRRAIRATFVRHLESLIREGFSADPHDRGETYAYAIAPNDPVSRELLTQMRRTPQQEAK